jgi:NAD(P)-dependent dehydrogenase (short-subunit alcohol dehydrogenase family)
VTLDGTVAIVFDESSGLGAATHAALRRHGATVIVAGPDDQGYDRDVVFVKNDWTDEAQVARVCDTARRYGPVRTAVSISGVSASRRLVDRFGAVHPLGDFDRIVKEGIYGPFNVMRLVAAEMTRNEPDVNDERGVIVNTSSVAAYDGQVGQVAYAAAKGGVAAMTLPAARDLAPAGIRICTIAPGLFATPKAAGLPADIARSVPQPQRLGHPAEFADLVVHIVLNPYLNGEVIRLDGGLRLPAK